MPKRHLQHIKSSQANKIPTANDLLYGEIAVNYAEGSETIYIKNSNNEIVPFVNGNKIEENELVVASALNELNDRINEDATAVTELESTVTQLKEQLDNLKVTVINMKANGYEWVDLGLPSGKIWATMNVGAETVTGEGLYFAWGETQGYAPSEIGNSAGQKSFLMTDYSFYDQNYNTQGDFHYTKYNTTDLKTTLDIEDDAVHTIMGGDWHLPSVSDFIELFNPAYVDITSDANGIVVTSKINGNEVHIPISGRAYYGEIDYTGTASLWTNEKGEVSTFEPQEGEVSEAYCMLLNDYTQTPIERYGGMPLRGVIG